MAGTTMSNADPASNTFTTTNFHRISIWNMKYLHGYKWQDLMEQVQGEERIREGRLRAEIQKEARERKAFLSNVELAKRERGMEAKRKRKKLNVDEKAEGEEVADQEVVEGLNDAGNQERRKFERRFRQNEVFDKSRASHATEQSDDVRRVLSKIF